MGGLPVRASRRAGRKWEGPGHDLNAGRTAGPFADALPVPQRLVAARQNGRLSVRGRRPKGRMAHSREPREAKASLLARPPRYQAGSHLEIWVR